MLALFLVSSTYVSGCERGMFARDFGVRICWVAIHMLIQEHTIVQLKVSIVL